MKSADRTDNTPLILPIIQSKPAATGAAIPALVRRDATAYFTDRRTPRACSGGTKVCEKAAIRQRGAALPIRLSADWRQALSLEAACGLSKGGSGRCTADQCAFGRDRGGASLVKVVSARQN